MAVFGDTLRQARAYKGVTLKEAEQATRINRHHLAALEDENFGVLPPLIYQRGIVRNYAAYLDLDPGKLLSMFDEARGGESTAELVAAVKPLDMPSHWAPNFAIIAFLVVMSAIVFAWVYSASFAQNGAPATASSLPLPTVTPTGDLALADLPSPTTQPTSAPAPQEAGAVATAPEPTAREINPAQLVPTSTPSPTPRAVATATPRPATATAVIQPPMPTAPLESPTEVVDQSEELTAASLPVEEAVAEQPVQQVEQAGLLSISIQASAEIYLTLSTSSGEVLYEGTLSDGQAIGPYSAEQYFVTTSDSLNTQITNYNNNTTFNMGAGVPEFSLP